jgi:FOG: FHA domain
MLNHQWVRDTPLRLQHGDEVCFAGTFVYKVKLVDEGEAQASPQTPPLCVILEMHCSGVRTDVIVITHFPFLISRTDVVFSRYKKTFLMEVDRISHRHAYIFLRDGNAYIEDLGSKNGTFVSGVRLEDEPKRLQDGESVAFGSKDFAFTVHVKPWLGEGPADATAPGIGRLLADCELSGEHEGTIFVDSPTSFLEIFCASGSVDEKEPQGEEFPGVAQEGEKHKRGHDQGLVGRIRAFLRELKVAFSGETPTHAAYLWVGAGSGVLVLLTAILVYMHSADEREIKALLDQGKYAEGAVLANQYLERYPSDSDISALATQGLLKAVLPDWMAKLENKEFAAANSLLQDAKRDLSPFNGEGQKMLESLEWIGSLEKFIAERGGLDAPLVIFAHETPMEELIGRWESDTNALSRSLTRIMSHVPAFEPVYSRALSELRGLRDERSLYLKAIEKLKQDIEKALDTGHAAELAADLDAFEKKYAKIGGTQRIRDDLNGHLTLQRAVDEKNINEILRVQETLAFQTPLFRARVEGLMKKALPPKEVLLEYRHASELWRAGKVNEAMAILEGLSQREWGEVATQRLAHYQSVAEGYKSITQARGTEGYGKQLLAFYGTLDSMEDNFFLHAIEPDFLAQKDRVLLQAKEWSRVANQAWNSYLKNNGINATIRVERVISETYKAQAGRLAESYEHIIRVINTYALLKQDSPAEITRMHDEIASEVRRQRQWLSDLNLVLESSLLQKKLQLLPEL